MSVGTHATGSIDTGLRVGLLSEEDARTRRHLSGIPYYMAQALARHLGEITYLGPVQPRIQWAAHRLDRLVQLGGRRYDATHSILVARRCARIIRRRLAREPVDVLVAPYASTLISELETEIPIVYTSDSTFAQLKDYYPEFSNLLGICAQNGHRIEAAAVARARLLLYPTEWAARSAREDYGAAPDRVHVVPYGANLDAVPSRREALDRKRPTRCRLLFVGVEWERKGADIAVETVRALNRSGVPAELTICGCTPPEPLDDAPVTVHPFLDKNDPEDRRSLDEIFRNSDFLVVPTRSEAYGLVFCEAMAYGLPVIATATGGVSGVVRHGKTGYLLPPEAHGDEYARTIVGALAREGLYEQLVGAARMDFEARLNWDAWARTTTGLVQRLLGRTSAAPPSSPASGPA